MPVENLPSLDGHRDYMRIYNIQRYAKELHHVSSRCNIPEGACGAFCTPYNLNTTENEMRGQTTEILRLRDGDENDVFAILKKQSYTIKHDQNGSYYVNMTEITQEEFRLDNGSATIMCVLNSARKPYDDYDGGVYYIHDAISPYTLSFPGDTGELKGFLSGAINFGVDREHVDITFNHADMSDAALLDAVNSTYVNIVHDCNVMCFQSVLSGRQTLMSNDEIAQSGLLCTNMILEYSSMPHDGMPRVVAHEQRDSISASENAPQTLNTVALASGAAVVGVLVSGIAVGIAVSLGGSRIVQYIRQRTRNALQYKARSDDETIESEMRAAAIQDEAQSSERVRMIRIEDDGVDTCDDKGVRIVRIEDDGVDTCDDKG